MANLVENPSCRQKILMKIIEYVVLTGHIWYHMDTIESCCHNLKLLVYKLMYGSTVKEYVSREFRHLIYKNYKINPQIDTNLYLYGDFMAAFITGCKNISEYECVVTSLWDNDMNEEELKILKNGWTDEELKNLKKEITISDIDRIYNISYRQHEGKNKCDYDFDGFLELKFCVRMRYKNKKLYIFSRQNFSNFYYDDDDKETRYGPGYTLVCTHPVDFGQLYRLEFSNDIYERNNVEFFKRDGIYVPFLPLEKQEYTNVRESYDSTVCDVESHWKNNSEEEEERASTKKKNKLKEDLKRVAQITAGVIGIGFLTYQLKKKFL